MDSFIMEKQTFLKIHDTFTQIIWKTFKQITMPWHSSSINSCHERAKWKMQKKKKRGGVAGEKERQTEK